MIKVIQIRKATKGRPAGYMVKSGDRVIGFIDKYRSTRTETHPWKAFAAKMNADGSSSYAAEIAFRTFYESEGGRAAAIEFLRKRAEGFPVGTSVSFVDQFGYRIYGTVKEFVDGRFTIIGADNLTYQVDAARVGAN